MKRRAKRRRCGESSKQSKKDRWVVRFRSSRQVLLDGSPVILTLLVDTPRVTCLREREFVTLLDFDSDTSAATQLLPPQPASQQKKHNETPEACKRTPASHCLPRRTACDSKSTEPAARTKDAQPPIITSSRLSARRQLPVFLYSSSSSASETFRRRRRIASPSWPPWGFSVTMTRFCSCTVCWKSTTTITMPL